MKKRLCIVTPVHWKAFMGGAQYQIKCLLEHLRTLDCYDVHYLAHRVPEDRELDGYSIHRIGRGHSVPRIGYIADAPALYRTLRRLRPDVIYQRIGCAYTGIAAQFSRQHKSGLVWHASSDTDVQRGLKIAKKNVLRDRLDRALLSYGILRADKIVTQTNHQARLLQQGFHRRADAVVANFHPDPTEPVDKSGPIRIAWVANLKRTKQPEVFLRLAAALRDLHGARFVMIGADPIGGSESHRRGSLLQDIAAAPNVECLGQLSQQDVNTQLAKAHIFVNTSLYEGFPNTFIQSWMRNVCIVSLNVNPDGLLDGDRIGFYAGTEERLADIVRRLVTDTPLREVTALRGNEYARTFHSMTNAHRLEELIRDAASTRANRRD
jgi:glycosyltransferase involved in cell wall biosynthesis